MLVRSQINSSVLNAYQELKESVWSERVWGLGQARDSLEDTFALFVVSSQRSHLKLAMWSKK